MKIKRVRLDDEAPPIKSLRSPDLVTFDDLPRESAHPLVDATVGEVEDGVGKMLRGQDAGPQPWCTCGKSGGFTFDWQLGIYVHGTCYKPSFAYYKAAIQAGIIKPSQMSPFTMRADGEPVIVGDSS